MTEHARPRSVAVAISPEFHRRILSASKLLRISPSEALRRALDAGLNSLCRAHNCRCKHAEPKTLADLSKRGDL